MIKKEELIDTAAEHLNREYAVIIFDGHVYISCFNHQELLNDISSEFKNVKERGAAGKYGSILDQWDGQNYDLSDDLDIDAAIQTTDLLFKENRLFGFDIYEGKNEKYLVSHYMSNLENEECMTIAQTYAKENGYILAAFENMSSHKFVHIKAA